MNRDDALKKIKKCLALAKSSNPHEAAAAMRQAQKLMAEHQVTEVDVGLADVAEATVKTQLKTATKWEGTLARMIADAFGCEYFGIKSRYLTHGLSMATKREYVFVGMGAASQVAAYAYDVLARQCGRDRLAHIQKQPKSCKPITKTARGDEFALGWVYGVHGLVERFAGAERNQALIGQYMATKYPDLTTTKIKSRAVGRNVRYADQAAGHSAGQKAQLNRGLDGVAQQGLLT
jgi:hypothetical protein